MDRKPQTRLDHRRPLVLDTRELGRRPGSMREVRRTAAAPEGLGIVDLIGVPAGADVELDLRLESVMEGVLVTGTARGQVHGECGRCLDPVSERLQVPLQELYVYDPDPDAEDEARMEGDLLDLEPALRDAVVLALPLTPLCSPDCGGLCVDCGERLDDLPPDHGHDAADPRWSALAGLLAADLADALPADLPASDRSRPGAAGPERPRPAPPASSSLPSTSSRQE